jgi:protein involved in polysaccharide export with SLBB domain
MKTGKFIFIIGFSAIALAQQPVNRPTPTFYPEPNLEYLPEVPVDPNQYTVKPGDSVLVIISGTMSYSYQTGLTPSGDLLIEVPTGNRFITSEAGTLPILSANRLQLDIIDRIDVHGLTIKEAEKTLGERFARYLRNVNVTLSLLAPRRFKVFVLGEVKVPGDYIASSFFRVANLISKAQGVAPMGSRCNIELRRNGKLFAIVDLEKFERLGNLDDNPPVSDGDVIYVPIIKSYVTIRGGLVGRTEYALQFGDTMRFSTNETYELRPNETFLDIVLRAGGPVPWADLKNSYIERLPPGSKRREKIPVDLYKIMIDKVAAGNPVLENGDIVVVPRLEPYVYVHGAVANPGPYWFDENRKVSEYVGRAGGFTPRADINKVKLIKADGKSSFAYHDPLVDRGESIYVPERPVYNWQIFLSLGATITTLITAWITLTSR